MKGPSGARWFRLPPRARSVAVSRGKREYPEASTIYKEKNEEKRGKNEESQVPMNKSVTVRWLFKTPLFHFYAPRRFR